MKVNEENKEQAPTRRVLPKRRARSTSVSKEEEARSTRSSVSRRTRGKRAHKETGKGIDSSVATNDIDTTSLTTTNEKAGDGMNGQSAVKKGGQSPTSPKNNSFDSSRSPKGNEKYDFAAMLLASIGDSIRRDDEKKEDDAKQMSVESDKSKERTTRTSRKSTKRFTRQKTLSPDEKAAPKTAITNKRGRHFESNIFSALEDEPIGVPTTTLRNDDTTLQKGPACVPGALNGNGTNEENTNDENDDNESPKSPIVTTNRTMTQESVTSPKANSRKRGPKQVKSPSPEKKLRTSPRPRQKKLNKSSANWESPIAVAGSSTNDTGALNYGTNEVDSNSLSAAAATTTALVLNPASSSDASEVKIVKTRKRYYLSSKSSEDAYDAIYGPKGRTCLSCKRIFPSASCLVYHLEHNICGLEKPNAPFPILHPGERFVTQYGVVEVIVDDRIPTDYDSTAIPENIETLVKRYNRWEKGQKAKKQTAGLQKALDNRRRREKMKELYLHSRSTTDEKKKDGKVMSQDNVWKLYCKNITPGEILRGTRALCGYFKDDKKERNQNIMEDPREPRDSYPDRIVECFLITDERHRETNLLDDDRDSGFSCLENERHPAPKIRFFIQRRFLTQIYCPFLSVYVCSFCGYNLTTKSGLNSHLKLDVCHKKSKRLGEKISERIQTRESLLISQKNYTKPKCTSRGVRSRASMTPEEREHERERDRDRKKRKRTPPNKCIYRGLFFFLQFKRGGGCHAYRPKKIRKTRSKRTMYPETFNFLLFLKEGTSPCHKGNEKQRLRKLHEMAQSPPKPKPKPKTLIDEICLAENSHKTQHCTLFKL
uniref:C2H2-type domain-containing protein n=1 Tax=Ditylum brightwellii TaxID=49249 RepID=A0A7S2EML4_9STRA|mmetsp:Transcript_36479/g.54488  ORF Transcript_36479/g.54488 Transcript_36479/m.54488 type:complete len:825 (+) Transcript_36479:154-2628(+)